MSLKIGLTYNLKGQSIASLGLPVDFDAEFDDETTVDAIAVALKRSGCKVVRIEADENAYGKLNKINPEIVFNIAEGLGGESRESQIPAMLEMLGIPYTGSGPLTLAIALDKSLTHIVLSSLGVPSPSFQVLRDKNEDLDKELAFPLVVKPLAEGSSKGITNSSLVNDTRSLRSQLSIITEKYKQPAIVEEFLPGREFTVGLIGNDEPTILPIVEILLEKLPEGVSQLYSYEAKWVWDTPEKPLDIFCCPAELDQELEGEIKDIAVRTFKVLGCKDLCRTDIRLDVNGEPHVIEVNPLPGLIPDPNAHSCLPEAARTAGFTYDQLICTILWQGLKRYDMQGRFENHSLIKIA